MTFGLAKTLMDSADVQRADFDAKVRDLENAKALITDLYSMLSPEVPSDRAIRELIERRTGCWFAWGVNRDADGVKTGEPTERLEPHSPPGLHLASNYYGLLRRHAHGLKDPTRGAVEQAAELIDRQRLEIRRLTQALEAALGVKGPEA